MLAFAWTQPPLGAEGEEDELVASDGSFSSENEIEGACSGDATGDAVAAAAAAGGGKGCATYIGMVTQGAVGSNSG